MKKVFYNNKIAKTILMKGYSIITLFAWVLCKHSKSDVEQWMVNHECVHARQWTELAIASGLLIWITVLLGASPWLFLLCSVTFYVLYALEFIVRFAIALFSDNKGETVWMAAYFNVSFEQEARKAELDNNYLENSHYFAWHKHLKR